MRTLCAARSASSSADNTGQADGFRSDFTLFSCAKSGSATKALDSEASARYSFGTTLCTAEEICERAAVVGAEIIQLKNDRLSGLRGANELETYRNAKSTLAVVLPPSSARKLQPILASADWQFSYHDKNRECDFR